MCNSRTLLLSVPRIWKQGKGDATGDLVAAAPGEKNDLAGPGSLVGRLYVK